MKRAQLGHEVHEIASSVRDVVKQSDVSMICAPTPTVKGTVDLRPLLLRCAEVGRALRGRKSYHLAVARSTVPPGTTRGLVIPRIKESAELPSDSDVLGVCHNPEVMREKFAPDDFLEPRAIVNEQTDAKAGTMLESVYSSLKSPIILCSLETAEMIKFQANLFN